MFSGRVWQGGGGDKEQFPTPWTVPIGPGATVHCVPHKSELALPCASGPVGVRWLPSGWPAAPGSPWDTLSNKSPTCSCPGALEGRNRSSRCSPARQRGCAPGGTDPVLGPALLQGQVRFFMPQVLLWVQPGSWAKPDVAQLSVSRRSLPHLRPLSPRLSVLPCFGGRVRFHDL